MNPLRTNPALAADGSQPAHLLLAEGEGGWLAQDAEKKIADLRQRATQMSRVLEDILREPHGSSRWGLNE